MTLDLPSLEGRFREAVRAAGGAPATDSVFGDLVARYAEPHRYYHTLEHVDACLTWLDWFRGVADRAHETELALWFHDVVYDPRAHDNERQSAELSRRALSGLGIGTEALARIASHIEATQRHVATTRDARLVADVDLAILGARQPDFDRFETHIQAEYAHVPPALFRAGRRRILEGFLARERIYQTPEIRELLERSARSNLERRIAELAAGGEDGCEPAGTQGTAR